MSRKIIKSILMYGYAGLYGTFLILEKKWEELGQRYDVRYLSEQRKIYKSNLDIKKPEMDTGDADIYEIAKGGVLTSLYALCKELNCGIGINMKDIPVIQSSIEICEYFKLNPYNMLSKAYLILADNAEAVKECMYEKGYKAVVIGALYEDKLKTVNDRYDKDSDEEISYINRPAKDEIYKIIKEPFLYES